MVIGRGAENLYGEEGRMKRKEDRFANSFESEEKWFSEYGTRKHNKSNR